MVLNYTKIKFWYYSIDDITSLTYFLYKTSNALTSLIGINFPRTIPTNLNFEYLEFQFFILWTCVCDVNFSGNTFQWTYEIELLLQQVNDVSSSQLKFMLRKQIPRYLQFSQEVCFSFLLYRNKKQTVLLTRYKYSHQKRFQITRLTHSFLIQPFSTPWKHQKTLRFSDIFRG